ncbi:hypothetical protein SAMN05444005_101836 [Flavobacterium urocaniciphilum]|uniref:Uncharacterized protein n=1 Tax=Flavobacterium urocaniciphilum TaxID=1299341 RepID=A0A1H8ZQ97_9FLAO|nr:hypothetical protein SAMN05444005_101836 [Flavobacterium urocaniciphilum]
MGSYVANTPVLNIKNSFSNIIRNDSDLNFCSTVQLSIKLTLIEEIPNAIRADLYDVFLKMVLYGRKHATQIK